MGKAWFFFRSTLCLFLEVHQVNCPAAKMFFLDEKFEKMYRVIPTDLPVRVTVISPSAYKYTLQ